MSKAQQKESWWRRLRRRYRVVLISEKTFEEKKSFRLSRLSVFIVISFFSFFLIGLTVLLFFVTPLHTLVPGYGDTSLRSVGEYNAQALDEIILKNQQYETYFQNINNILNGTVGSSDSSLSMEEAQPGLYDSLNLENSEIDSAFRAEVEDASAYALELNQNADAAGNVYFFAPVRGRITSSFNVKINHFGIDVATTENESAKATLEGTVVFASWTPEDGHVLHIQHSNNYLSVYKHNAVLHKKVGDRVKAGENVSIVGDSGENSTGPHLHFELWHNGIPVDPQQLIVFE